MANRNDPPRVVEAEPLGDGFFPDAFELEDGEGGEGGHGGHGAHGHGGHVTAQQAKDFFHEQIGDAAEKPRPGAIRTRSTSQSCPRPSSTMRSAPARADWAWV